MAKRLSSRAFSRSQNYCPTGPTRGESAWEDETLMGLQLDFKERFNLESSVASQLALDIYEMAVAIEGDLGILHRFVSIPHA